MENSLSAIDLLNTVIAAADDLQQLKREISEVKRLLQQPVGQPATIDERWFDLDELCNYLPGHPKKTTIYAKVKNRSIPHYNIEGRRLTFLKSEIDEWLKSKKK